MIRNKKAISQCWQQSQNHLQTNNKAKVFGKHEINSPLPPATSTQTPKDYERLRRRMWEMKHRVCLLEFGLGSVAKLVQGWACDTPVENPLREEGKNVNLEDDGKRSKKVIMGIGAILKDIETCMQSGFSTAQPSYSGEKVNMEQLVDMVTPSNQGTCKSTILIDELKTGGNCLTAVATATMTNGLCKIQVMENTVMFPPSSQEQHEKCIKTNKMESNIQSINHNQCSTAVATGGDPIQPLDALSTLAFVASYKHANEFNEIGKTKFPPKTQEDLKQKATGNTGHEVMTRNQAVNPFIYSEENDTDNVPLIKRQRRDGGAPSKANLEVSVVHDGKITKKRRTLRQ